MKSQLTQPPRTDHVSSETRSRVMRAVKSKGARSTERRLRALLVRLGYKGWHMHAKSLPGKPDFYFPQHKLAIFVDGCFWHGCPLHYRRPASSQNYWDAKVRRNVKRDRANRRALRQDGWGVLRIWEHELSGNMRRVNMKIEAALARLNSRLAAFEEDQ